VQFYFGFFPSSDLIFLFFSISWSSQSGDDPDLAKYGYKVNTKVKHFKTSFYIVGWLLEPCLDRNLAINLKFLVELWQLKNSKST
jgi:hypothetical protein